MKVVYYDGSELDCENIEVVDGGKTLIADDVYIVPIDEVLRIVSD